jgi:hypothetical protein
MDVYNFFSCLTKLPVRVDSVVEFLKDAGIFHEVYFSEVEMDPSVLWAQVRAYYPTTAYDRQMPPILEIMYSAELNDRQARLACCKELLHALDEIHERAVSQEDVETLIQQMSIPPNAGFSLPAANDHMGIVKALVVLVPHAALADLRPAYERGEISEGEIANALELPVEYVRLTLAPFWDELCDKIV